MKWMNRRLAAAMSILGIAAFMSQAHAQGVPDPTRSTIPSWIYVVGRVGGGAAVDPHGLATVIVRDFANNPVPNALVQIDFSRCCDLRLCSAVVDGQTVDCPNGIVSGHTDSLGRFRFTVLGAGRDPGNIVPCVPPGNCVYPGCGGYSVWVHGDPGGGKVLLGTTTASVLDQNGAASPPGSNGTTVSDVANLINLWGAYALGQPYVSRGDMNGDGNLTFLDVSMLLGHMGRLALIGGVGCPGTFCPRPACP